MRLIPISAALLLSACATGPSATQFAGQPMAELQAQQRDLANAEARVKQLRTIIDLDEDADADDLRAYNTARDELSRLRSHTPTVESGYNDLGWNPLESLPRGGWSGGWSSEQGDSLRSSFEPAPLTMQPLSGNLGAPLGAPLGD